MSTISIQKTALVLSVIIALSFQSHTVKWISKFVKLNKDGSLQYIPDGKGNIIPDFSRVGYHNGDKPIPTVEVVKTVSATGSENDEPNIQSAITEVSKLPLDKNGFRGAILLKKGTYKIPNSIHIAASGIVLRGEADETKLIATAKKQVALINVSGTGNISEVKGSRVRVTDVYVPTGAFSFTVSSSKMFSKGDKIILFRPGTQQWIDDLKMNQIEDRGGTRQWQPKEYDLQFERVITKIEGNKIFIDNPVVMPIEAKYGGAEIYKYKFDGRINHVGIEHLYFESEYEKDTSENHAWDAVEMNKVEHSWVRNVTAKHFGFSCVNLSAQAKNISV
ncbi:MAG TPA: hypothetical protein VL946_07260, partial [Lacibacter sp.]|nr:hypothetical protein [Lacibacter sp.]